MVKVAIVMPGKGEGHARVSKAFQEKLTKLVPGVETREFVSDRADYRLFTEMVGAVLAERFDLIVTVGTKCTVIMQDAMREKGVQIPLVFIGVVNPEGFEVIVPERREQISGIAMHVPSDSLPLDAVFMICGLGRRIVILYREDTDNGRASYMVEKMERYAYDAKVTAVRSLGLSQEQVSVAYLSKKFEKGDVVVAVRGGLFPQDLAVVEEACKNVGADFFNGANSMVPPTALCGYISDVEYLGYRAALLAKRVLVDGELLANIPYETPEDTTKIVVNTTVLAQRGIALPSKDYIFSIDDQKTYQVLYRTSYPFVYSTMVEQEMRLAEKLAEAGQEYTPGIEYIPVPVHGLHNNDQHRAWVVAQTMEQRQGQAVVVGGELMAHLLQQEMIKQQKFRSIVIIKSSDDDLETRAEKSAEGWPSNYFIQRTTLEVPKAAVLVDFMQFLHPDIKSMGCVYSYEHSLMPSHLQRRLAALREECEGRGLLFEHAGSGMTNHEFEIAHRLLVERVDAVACWADALRPSDGLYAAFVCHEKNKLFVGSDLARSDRHGAVMGPRYELIAKKLMTVIGEATLGRQPESVEDLFFTVSDIYAWCVNEKWLALHQLPMPANAFGAFTCVPAIWDAQDPFGGVLSIKNLTAEKMHDIIISNGEVRSRQK